MRRRIASLVALALLAASFSLGMTATPAAASSAPARLPAGFHIALPWASGAEHIECAYHGYQYSKGCSLHKNVDLPSRTNDEYALDFGLPRDTPVLAVASGRVMWAGWARNTGWAGFGNSVSIVHYGAGTGFTSFYAHLSKIVVKSRQVVRAGQVIGYSGETGTEGGYHLHFAMYYNAGGIHTLHTTTIEPPYGGVAAIPEPFSNCSKSNGSSCTALRVGDVLVPGGVTPPAQTGPSITGVDVSWLSGQNASFTIHGSGFGSMSPYDGDTWRLRVEDGSGMWGAGYSGNGDAVHVNVTSWTDNAITVASLTGQYNQNGWTLHAGDSMHVLLWNAQTGRGPSLYSFTMPAPAASPPPAPTNIAATAADSTDIALRWTDNSGGTASYQINRWFWNPNHWAAVATTGAGATSFTDGGLTPNTGYGYLICATTAAGTTCPANYVSATTPPNVVLPPAPTGVTATAISSTCVDVTWSDTSGGQAGYYVNRAGSPPATNSVGASATAYQDCGLTPNTTYSYLVGAFNAAGTSWASNGAWVTTPAASSGAPAFGGCGVTEVGGINCTGGGFGAMAPYDGVTTYLAVNDLTGGWGAGFKDATGQDWVTLKVSDWEDTVLIIDGFTGYYGQYGWVAHSGDSMEIKLWNPQTGQGPATYDFTWP